MRSITKLDLQYAHRFYGFKGEELLDESRPYFMALREKLSICTDTPVF